MVKEVFWNEVGHRKGETRLWRSWISPEPSISSSTLEIRPGKEGEFPEIHYTWEVDGTTQQGRFIVSVEGTQASVTWTDTWHSTDGMACHGTLGEVLDVTGSYPAPPGPDWGWRILISPTPDFRVEMENITPQGERERAFLMRYPKP